MDVEEIFWQQLERLTTSSRPPVSATPRKSTYRYGGEAMADTPFGEELSSTFGDMQQSAMRSTRFHAIETFMTVLLGSGPHGPVPRFAARFRNDKFNTALAEVGKRTIPTELAISGIDDFQIWLAAKFWGRREQEPLTADVVDFIALQALFYSQKSTYNAFKHGCRVGHTLPKFSFQNDETGEWIEPIKMDSAVAWMDWSEKGNKSTVQYGVVECDGPDDHGAILVMGMLVRAMKTFRLRKPDQPVDIQMPSDITLKKTLPQNWTMKMVLTPAPRK